MHKIEELFGGPPDAKDFSRLMNSYVKCVAEKFPGQHFLTNAQKLALARKNQQPWPRKRGRENKVEYKKKLADQKDANGQSESLWTKPVEESLGNIFMRVGDTQWDINVQPRAAREQAWGQFSLFASQTQNVWRL